MNQITTICIEHDGFSRQYSTIITRNAVRALVVRQNKLLMVLSAKVGDYKFAGGGIHDQESPQVALKREVLEETGYQVDAIGRLLLRVEEYRNDVHEKNTCFMMISEYFSCTVHDTILTQNLDTYEKALGFTPVWISPNEALRVNDELLRQGGSDLSPWIIRESRVLKELYHMNYLL